MAETHLRRANMIDGLPSSFDVTYVIKTGKKCSLCTKRIKKEEVSKNEVIYTDEFEFSHKPCLSTNGLFYEHIRPDDASSPVKLMNKKIKKNQEKKTAEQNAVSDASKKS
jgi:hypothetical protein